jgi:branched-chain amino acid transport system substrate-binding protein
LVNQQRRKLLKYAAAGVVVLGVGGGAYYYLSRPPKIDRTIKIGLLASLTGLNSDTGTDMQRASLLAIEEINRDGGVYVKEYDQKLMLELVSGDDKSSPQEGVTAVKRLILEDGTDLLVGGASSPVTVAAQVPAIESKVPFIITGASTSLVTRRTDMDASYMFHYCSVTDDYSEVIVQFLADVMKPKVAPSRNFKLAFLYQDSSYGKGCYDSSVQTIKDLKLPIDIVAAEKFVMGDVDFHTQLSKIKAANPDGVYHAGLLADTATAIKQGLGDVGLKTVYVAVEICDDPNFFKLIGEWADYQVLESKFSSAADSYMPSVDKYVAAYKKKWNILPGMMGADTYDAIYLTKAAIEKAGTLDKAKLRDAIENISIPQMLIPMKNGTISFDKNHEIQPICFIEQLRYDKNANTVKPSIVYPDKMKTKSFELPPFYKA